MKFLNSCLRIYLFYAITSTESKKMKNYKKRDFQIFIKLINISPPIVYFLKRNTVYFKILMGQLAFISDYNSREYETTMRLYY